jgi:hypothetical protein
METESSETFPLVWDENQGKLQMVKWSIGAAKHEILTTILNKFDLHQVVAHVTSVMHLIDQCVGGNAAHRFQSYRTVMPHTLSIPMLAAYDTVEVDHPLATQDVAGFHGLMRHFIEAHAIDDARHDLLAQIRNARKPHNMGVQAFFFHLRELNEQAAWLPSAEAILTNTQID